MRILVLGGTGLLGTPIVERLVAEGHELILFNRGVTHSRLSCEVEMLHGNRNDFEGFEEQMSDLDVDAVVDMLTYDARTAEHGVQVFAGKVKRYLFCSTVCVYGGPLASIPADEMTAHRPVSQYGTAKSDAERIFAEALVEQEFPVTILRPGHSYGSGEALLNIWGYDACLASRVREEKPVVVPGDGYGLLQPVYAEDVATAFAAVVKHEKCIGQTYNVVPDEVCTWREYFETMAKVLEVDSNLISMTTAQIISGLQPEITGLLEEIFQYNGAFSNTALKRDLSEVFPFTPLEQGLRETVAWMDDAHAHLPTDDQPWLDALVDQALEFEAKLAMGEFAFDDETIKGDSM